MIKLIVGEKGSGKTARLVDDLNMQATSEAANVVCLEFGKRLNGLVKYQIRLIDVSQYPVRGYDQLLSFIAGISAKDFDVTHIYIDSIGKISGDSDLASLESFLEKLEVFAERDAINVMIILSADPDDLSPGIQKYC
ncbi:MAG: hypothetical protein ACOX1A_06835 [Saccharofermentanales bacterium]|jgi:hypothetical protein|nr:hypothetical protein [Clostridiaceae bacterium]